MTMMINNYVFPIKYKLPLVMVFSFVIGFILAILSLPIWANLLRPQWIVLLLLYWMLEVPSQMGLFGAWLIGLFMDSLLDIPLGTFAISLVLIAYLLMCLRTRFDIFSSSQKLAIIFGFMILYQIPYFVFEYANGNSFSMWLFLLPPLISTLIWSYFAFFMHNWCKKFYVKNNGVIQI